jgi:hypothetical protein
MPLNLEYLGIVARIDARIQQLDALGLSEFEIKTEMADLIADYHSVISLATHRENEALCAEFAGFQRFAKIMQTLATPLGTDSQDVSSGLPNESEDKVAAAIDQRVLQLEAKGIDGAELLKQMVGYIFNFQWLWTTVSDAKLAQLCHQYPGLYRYGLQMEKAAAIENQKKKDDLSHLPELPDILKEMIGYLLTEGGMIETRLQMILDERILRESSSELKLINDYFEHWMEGYSGLEKGMRAAQAPEEIRGIVMKLFEPMALRIIQLHNEVYENRN